VKLSKEIGLSENAMNFIPRNFSRKVFSKKMKKSELEKKCRFSGPRQFFSKNGRFLSLRVNFSYRKKINF